MMKLDNLKDAWKQYAAQAAAVHQVTEDQISGLMKARTENAVTKLKKNIYFELGVQLLTVVLFGIGAVVVQGDEVMKALCVMIMVICLPFLGYFWARLQHLRQLNVTTANLRATLRNLTEMLTGLIKLYFWTNMLLAPLGLVAGQLVILKLAYGINISHLPWEQMYLRLMVGFVIGAVVGYLFLKWYIRKMFGNHLKTLKGAYCELESLEIAA
ncbi:MULTISPECIES: hypothetical protein [Rufibacter]|uniref:Uncharacterized protein n=1 Tax=Rufibacter quisquiliarum TaxID=1549639 RepID=A0A839GH16_9BACT|nr:MULTISPECIES: hypothetical protein [Rufibacter]MBA9075969.1 hypothetical protein [Rufibacter quisquiliarum]